MFKKSCLFVGSTLLASSVMFAEEAAPEAAAATPAAAEVAAPEYSDAEMLELLGYSLVYQTGIKDLGFTAADAESIGKGIAIALGQEGDQPSADIMAKMPAFQAFMQPRVMAAQAKAQAAQAEAAAAAEASAGGNIAAGKAFIESLKAEDATIEASESGLHYKITEPGADAKPTLEDTVLVHYHGTRIDGTVFDSSVERGQPATFPLNGVVPGFGEGLTKVGVGGKITLYIPSDLAYGNNPRPGGAIQPGDTLIFECELIEVNPGS